MFARATAVLLLTVSMAAAPAKAAPRKKPRRAPNTASPPVSAPPFIPQLEADDTPVEDVDVSHVPPPPIVTPLKPEPPRTTPVAGDDGERFRLRTLVSAAAYGYAETGATPIRFNNGYVNASLELSRRLFRRWVLSLSADSPVFSIAGTAPANFGPLFGRFSIGRDFLLGEKWDGTAYLSYLFLTALGTSGGFGFSDVSGMEAAFRTRYRTGERTRLEMEVRAALLGSRQNGVVTGDRYLGLQFALLWVGPTGVTGWGPFVAVDETKAEFANKRTAGGRFRIGVVAEL